MSPNNPAERFLNLARRPPSSASDARRPSCDGFQSGLLVMSRVRRTAAGVGAVVYEVKELPSDRMTSW